MTKHGATWRCHLPPIAVAIGAVLLMHFDTVMMGPVKVSHAWKVAAVTLACLLVRTKALWQGTVFLGICVIAIMLSPDSWRSADVAISNAFYFLLVGIMVEWLKSAQVETIVRYLSWLSAVMVIAFVPYHVGLLESLGATYDVALFGLGGSGLVGPFQTPHAASTSVASALLFLMWRLNGMTSHRARLAIILLLVLGGYFLTLIFVRTGWAMFLSGTALMLVSQGISSRASRRTLAAMVALAAIVAATGYADAIVDRVLGRGVYHAEQELAERGSGRVGFAIAAADIVISRPLLTQLVGVGQEQVLDEMQDRVGMRVFSHNGVIDMYLAYGLAGLFGAVGFLNKAFRALRAGRRMLIGGLGEAMLASYCVMVLLQGFYQLVASVYIGSVVAILIGLSRQQGRSYV